jgi:hypothetical protein
MCSYVDRISKLHGIPRPPIDSSEHKAKLLDSRLWGLRVYRSFPFARILGARLPGRTWPEGPLVRLSPLCAHCPIERPQGTDTQPSPRY